MPDTQPTRLGKYEILADLGKGGFATVYRAHDPDLGREVALKVLDPLLMRDPAWVARFRREARVIAGLDHPRIVPIHEIGQAEGILFIAMKLLPGGSLADRIARGPLPWAEVVRLTGEIAEALDFAHSRGVLHRDLKPANVLLDADGHAVLTDFGFARLVGESSMSTSVSGGVVGTPAYIAPEMWEDQPPTVETDLYALGCIVYEVAAGKRLFAGDTTPAVMRAHFRPLVLPERWPEGVPTGLGDVLGSALAKAPAERYARAGELATAVANLTIDTLAEPYAALQAAVAGGRWSEALTLAGQIRTQKQGYRDVAALEAQALAGQERAARAKRATTWRMEAEAALAQGDHDAAALAARQWAKLTPDDPALVAFRDGLQAVSAPVEERKPAAAATPAPQVAPELPPRPAEAKPPSARSGRRPIPLWAVVGVAVLLTTVVLLTWHWVREERGVAETPSPTVTMESTAVAGGATASLATDLPTPTPTPTATQTYTATPSATPSPVASGTPRMTQTVTVTPTRSPTPRLTNTVTPSRTAVLTTPTLLPAVQLRQPDGSSESGRNIHFSWTGYALSATQGYALLVWPDNGVWANRGGLDLPAVAAFCQTKLTASEFDLPSEALNNAPWIGPGRYYWTVVVVDTARKDTNGRCVIVSRQANSRSFTYGSGAFDSPLSRSPDRRSAGVCDAGS